MLALALVPAPNPAIADCANAAQRYNAAVGRVVQALRAYGACIAASNQRDDCAGEIEALDNAHDGFAQAVTDAKDCHN
jgi:hypothetical protein